MLRITQIKQGFIDSINKVLQDNTLRAKITNSNYDENTDNIPASVSEINVLYVGSNWEGLSPNTKQLQNYNRTYEFNIFVKIKNIRTEDQVQDLNDLLINGIGETPLFNRYPRIISDEFDELIQGIWIYRQTWNYILEGVTTDSNCDYVPIEFNDLRVSVSASYDTPLNFEIASSIIDKGNYQNGS